MHAKVVPSLLKVLKEITAKNDLTLQKGLFALHEFTNNLMDDVKLYLDDIVNLLLTFLNNHSLSRDVRYWALSALGSAVSSAGKRILPYQEPILKSIYDTVTNEQAAQLEMQVKGQALMCAG